MMTSVLIFEAGSGAATPPTVVNGFIVQSPSILA
jgi:hypothetical protein